MNQWSEMLDRANIGTVSTKELGDLSVFIGTSVNDNDLYYPLLILGKAGGPEYSSTVEQFISSTNPMIARLSLQILCQFWGLTDRYLNYALRALGRPPSDDNDTVRQMAIFILGDYLASNKESGIIVNILRIFDDEHQPYSIILAAYAALALAIGREWLELGTTIIDRPDLRQLIASDIIDAVRRIANECQ